MNFSSSDLEPCNAWRCATVGPGHAPGIEKQNAPAHLVTWDMRVTMQNNVDVIGRVFRRYMLQAEFETASRNIDDKWPVEIAVAVSAHKDNRRPDRLQLLKNGFRADVPEMPDLISAGRHFPQNPGQTIVRVGKNENAPRFSGFCVNCHVAF
jgi:hypothetical protein